LINYYLFKPTVAGNYQITTSNPEAVVSYWGGSIHTMTDSTASTDYANNAYTLNIKEKNLGATYVIGVTGASNCILEIIRLGDPILDESDFPLTVYREGTIIADYTDVPSGKTKNYVDITEKKNLPQAVLNETDGYYHLGDANGPILYMDLGSGAPNVPLYGMMGMGGVGGQNITANTYDDQGNLIRRETYNYLLQQYATSADANSYKVYPLNEDLKYIIQIVGEQKGWWDKQSPNYMFNDVPGLNEDIAWMFACCTLD